MAGTINISGLSSKIDWNSTVDGLISVGKRQVALLQNRQKIEVQRQDALSELSDRLRSLRTVAQGMSDQSDFYANKTTLSSNNGSVAASALLSVATDSRVASGMHEIVVQQRAEARRVSSAAAVAGSNGAVSNANSALGISGSFQIEGRSFSVGIGDSLQQIANSINAAKDSTQVSASIIRVGDNDLRLVLSANKTGAAGYSLAGTDLAGSLSGLGFAGGGIETQAGLDAKVKVDGIVVTRSNNTISDAIVGMTLDIKQQDPATTITVGVGSDTQAAREKIQQFVDAYNSVQGFLAEQQRFDPKTQSSGILAGNSILRSVQESLTTPLMNVVPGLASDRNRLVLAGIEPDASGRLMVNESRLNNLLQNDPAALRDLFAASASSGNPDIKLLTYGYQSPTGNYALNITQAASRASVTGSVDLSGGLAANQSITVTDQAMQKQAVVQLTAGMNGSAIAAALNSAFAVQPTDQHRSGNALTAGGNPATAATTLSALGLGIAAGDTIAISGTSRLGTSVSGSFTVLNPGADTVSDLLTAIQSAYGQKATASIDANGYINLTDNQSGDSLLSFSLSANNQGGGTLNFGTTTVVSEGRYALGLQADLSGNNLRISRNDYGALGFSIAQSQNGLGLADGSFVGSDVAGTINGLSTFGSGTSLRGTSGAIAGMSITYGGSATGAVGSFNLGMGIAASLDNALYGLSSLANGTITKAISGAQSVYDSLQGRIVALNRQLDSDRERMLGQFGRMETALAKLNATGQWLTSQIKQMGG